MRGIASAKWGRVVYENSVGVACVHKIPCLHTVVNVSVSVVYLETR